MQRVLVLDTNKTPLMPCHPAKARKLLKAGKAAVWRRYPFTIILKYAVDNPETQPVELKVDPGSKITGISIVAQFARGQVLIWAANLIHRAWQIEKALKQRRDVRRSRRSRKTRYRKPRFLNRKRASVKYEGGQRTISRSTNNKQSRKEQGRPSGWISPSLQTRVDNIYVWAKRLRGYIPIRRIEVETVRFDTQKLQNPKIGGVEYQQGTLFGYEVKEYLLEKYGRQCVYCDRKDIVVNVEHIVPKSRGGTSRVSNLVIACVPCNAKKGDRPLAEFLAHDPERLEKIKSQLKKPLKDVAAVNSTRKAVGAALRDFGLPTQFWSGGRTKKNRIDQGYEKDHYIDAACVGESGADVHILKYLKPLLIRAVGRGNRQRGLKDKHGFPIINKKTGKQAVKMRQKEIHGFRSGDIVKAVVTSGKKVGVYVGKVSVRATGSFKISLVAGGFVDGINWKYCELLQRADGYNYAN